MHTVIVVAIVAALALLLLFHAVRRWARAFLRPRGWKSARTPATLGLEAQPLAIDRDGAQLRGWFLRAAPGPRPTVIVAHGWNSHAGDMLLLAAPLVRAGYHAVVYDALGHGESDASEYTSLRHMRDDLETVLDWTLARADAAPGIALFGHSMGGAAAILVAARRDAVRALVCAGAPTDPLEITVEFLDGRGLPGRLIVRLLLPFWRPIVRESYPSLIPEARMAELRIPVLVLHGREDRQVAPSHAERLAARAKQGRLVMLESAGHMDLHAHAQYSDVVADFLGGVFGRRLEAAGRGREDRGGG